MCFFLWGDGKGTLDYPLGKFLLCIFHSVNHGITCFIFSYEWWPTLCDDIKVCCLLKTTKIDPLVVYWSFNISNNDREEWVHPINASRKEFGVMSILYPQIINGGGLHNLSCDRANFYSFFSLKTSETYQNKFESKSEQIFTFHRHFLSKFSKKKSHEFRFGNNENQ